ncbi:MAG: phosphatidylglycerophosphatase A, partial [Betaproteobacteria bacterium]|nr:phosphatidylglycerophosphatase A [Betaproteobacteria bacterium]
MKQRVSPGELRQALGAWAWFCATAGGLGHMWPASGTWGSLPPVVLFAGMGWLGAPVWSHVLAQLVFCAMASAGCLHHGGKVEAVVGRKDPGVVVVDEVAGMALTLVLSLVGIVIVGAPNAGAVSRALPMSLALITAAASFFWFRVMDVIKPPPARGLQRVPGGAGVLIDDLVVAPYAAIAVVVTL